jgi:hypothetical protein
MIELMIARCWVVQWFRYANAMSPWWLPYLMVYDEHAPQD